MFTKNRVIQFEKVESMIIFFSTLFIIGFFNEHITAVKNIGLYCALLLTIVKIYIFREDSMLALKITYVNNKTLILLIFLFLLFIFISSIFAYTDFYKSIHLFYKEIKSVLIFSLVIFFIRDKKRMIQWILYSSLIAVILLNIHFIFKAYSISFAVTNSFNIDRLYSNFFESLFSLLLALFFISKKLSIKYIIIFLLIVSFFMLLLTGARASLLNIFIQSFMFLIFLFINNRRIFNKHKKVIGITLLIVLFSSLFTFTYFNRAHLKIQQGTNSSGRDLILQDRLPIILESNNLFLGMGYGTYNYINFLNDYNAPQRLGRYDSDKKQYIYFHDEPYLLSIFYYYGFIGLFLIIFIIGKFIFESLKIKDNIIAIALLVSFIGFFFVRGLFEHLHLNIVIINIVFLIILKTSQLNENSLHIS